MIATDSIQSMLPQSKCRKDANGCTSKRDADDASAGGGHDDEDDEGNEEDEDASTTTYSSIFLPQPCLVINPKPLNP